MPATFDRVKLLASDIANSWYFRVWSFFWLFFALLGFSVLIIISRQSAQSKSKEYIQEWIENVDSIQFPSFHFRIAGGSQDIFQDVVCLSTDGTPVTMAPCEHMIPEDICQAVVTDNLYANRTGKKVENVILCSINITQASSDTMIAWELEGENVQNIGPNSYASIWINPSQSAWVFLQKAIISYKKNQAATDGWERNLVYESARVQPGVFNIITVISSFQVRHFDLRNQENGWRALGEIGGFAYWLVIMHTMVMIIVGFCMTNTSKFLKNDQSGYSTVDE